VSDTIFRDYRGVGCPMNFARITMELIDMPLGVKLHVLLDTETEIASISRSLLRDGQTVLASNPEKNYWSIIIQKSVDYV